MKVYTGLLALLFLLCTTLAMAQEQTSTRVVVIAKIKNEDGVTTTVTKIIDGEHADAYVKSMESDLEGQEFDITSESAETLIKEEVFMRGGHWKQSIWTNNEGVTKTKRAILGIYAEDFSVGEGLVVTGLTEKSGAAAAGIRQGDIIQTVDGKPVGASGSLRDILSDRKPGDQVEVAYLQQDGQNRKAMVVLSESSDFAWTPGRIERDPCQVFIGVYTSTHSTGGVNVNGVINDTPASLSGVQKGDIILEMDGIPVNTHNELLAERNKHKPDQAFTLTVLRNGATIDIDARFKACPTDMPETVKEEVVVATPPAAIDAPLNPEFPKLNLEVFQAFPNPTTGLVNMRFQAEALPTVVQIADVTGKVIFQDNLNNFNGYYDRQVDLTGAVPGTLTLTIRQGKQVFTQALVLITRA